MNNAGNTASIEERDAHCGDQHRGTVGARFIAPSSCRGSIYRAQRDERSNVAFRNV
ncbi:MAG TPA: hypothetical protein VKU38_01745 [Ktedonobacteraceae bacterium]|nr:hypothetical protein [Ktedonobacteraceae bacterium]